MFCKKSILVLLILFIYLITIGSTLFDNTSYASLSSDGEYVLNLVYTQSVNLTDYVEYYGSFKEYLLNYGIKYRVSNNTDSNTSLYNELFLMNRIVNKINVEYKLLINNSLEYTNYYTNYTYEQYSGFINITKLVLNINTTSRKNILNTNITILSIALLIRGLDISINYNESNQQYILNVEIRNLILNYSILEDEFVKKLLKIPGDLGTDLFFEQNILFVKANSWCENNYLNLERSILGLNTAYFIINNTYVLPIKLLGNYSQYVIIGFVDRVGIDSINWRLVFENKFVKANIVVNGYGFGTNIEEKILSSIRNIHELSKIYGCVKVSTSGFKIIYDDNMYESIDICSNMDLNKINIHIDSGRKRLFEINWVILITITILLAILLLIITLYFSTHRVR